MLYNIITVSLKEQINSVLIVTFVILIKNINDVLLN